MSIIERIDSDLKTALKSSDKQRVSILRYIKSALKNREIEKGRRLSDEEVIDVLSSLVKQIRESIDEFKKAQRPELVAKEEKELSIIKSYLPEELTEEELDRLIHEAVASTGAESVKDLGRVMKTLMPKIKGRADGRVVSEKVKAILTKGN